MFGKADHLSQLINHLKQQITIAKNNSNRKISAQILEAGLEALQKLNTQNEAQRLDLYVTVRGIVTLTANTAPIDLAKKIRLFFVTRARKIKGQTEDYNSNTPANVFCHKIAKLVFPNEPTGNVLLEEALTKDRAEPWMDYIEYSTELPPEGEWFRNPSNEVHNYATILERTICRLKEGYTQQSEIWFGSDPKTHNKPLTSADLNVIKQRTPTFAILVDYTQKLEAATQSQTKNAYDHFLKLRSGLLKGDVAHNGQELQASAEAYIAIAAFSEWWNSLSSVTQRRIRDLTIPSSCYGMNRMNDIINIILDDGHASQRDGVQYCIQLKGARLDEFLNHATIKPQLQTIQEGIVVSDPRVSNETLESWQQKITKELKTVRPLIQQESRLNAYAQSKGIVLHAFINEYFDLSVLEEEKISQSIHWWHQKYPFNQASIDQNHLSTMVKTIYEQQDVNVLLLLYAHYAYKPEKEAKVLLTTIKTRLHDLSKIKGFSFAHLQKKFPFFDTLSLQDEEIAYATFLEKFYRPSTQEDWEELITYLTHSNPDWLTPALFQRMLQYAENTQPSWIQYPNRNDPSHQCFIPDLLKIIYAEKVLRKEISAYKKTVENRWWKRHDLQRDASIVTVEAKLDQLLATRDRTHLIKHIKQQMIETQAEHNKGVFSWFTRSHLVQAYQRALALIEPDNRPSDNNDSWWGWLLRCFSRPSDIPVPGDRPPPPPPPPSAGAAAMMLVDVEPYMPRIQAEVSEWSESMLWRYRFRRFLSTHCESVRAQISRFRHSLNQAEIERAVQVESVEQPGSTHEYVATRLASPHRNPAPVNSSRNVATIQHGDIFHAEAVADEEEERMMLAL